MLAALSTEAQDKANASIHMLMVEQHFETLLFGVMFGGLSPESLSNNRPASLHFEQAWIIHLMSL